MVKNTITNAKADSLFVREIRTKKISLAMHAEIGYVVLKFVHHPYKSDLSFLGSHL